MKYLTIVLVILVIVALRFWRRKNMNAQSANKVKALRPMSPLALKFYTIWVFFTINIKRVFRDRLALFFTFLFPLIFLIVFGSLSHNSHLSLRIALINQSKTAFAKSYVTSLEANKVFSINKTITTLSDAYTNMGRGIIDTAVELPPNFGKLVNGIPTGQAIVHYTHNNDQAEQALVSLLQTQFNSINAKYLQYNPPLKVTPVVSNQHSLTSFDYTFTGLLGFSILGVGIFGPMNLFPELKKMGILRRLHTTPLRVWQFFLSNMVGQAVIGLLSLAVMLAVAALLYNIKIVGNLAELAVFLVLGIVLILGIGLALGGWAKNERQVAPLGNIIVFPMMFLTGVFFPRFLMPNWLQTVTTYMPLTPVIDGARMILTEGKSLLDLGPQLLVMGAWMLIIYAIAFKVFRWE